MKTLMALLMAALLTGCAAFNNGMKADLLTGNIEIAKARAQAAAKPILDASIPVPGCQAPAGEVFQTACVMKIVVHAPQGSSTGQVTMPDDQWARVADRAVGVLGTAAGLYLGGEAAVNLVEGASRGIANALTVQQPPTVVMQPSPLVVNQPAPVIVEQPAPVIVEQPAPVIVEPTIVQQTTFGP